MLDKIRRYLTLNMDFEVVCLQQWLFMSSREPGIERSHSFLCLLIIFTAQKCPFYQSSVSLKCPYSWWRHKHSFKPLAPVPQGPSVCPRVFLFLAHTPLDRRCRCEMTVGKSLYFIVTNFSFVIISRKGDFVDLLCEYFVMMTPNHIHRSQLWSSWK